jgi:hypothetical protein
VRKRFLVILLPLLLLLGACIPVTWPANRSWSEETHSTYPYGYTYDWLWISMDDAAIQDLVVKLGASGNTRIEAQVCFQAPAPGWFRLVAGSYHPGPPESITHVPINHAGCTTWVDLGGLGGASNPRPMGGLGAGEQWGIRLRAINAATNRPVVDIQTGVGAAVATGNGYVWYAFP